MMNASHKKSEVWSSDAYKAVLDYRQNGLTLKDIGEKFGVGRERIRQVIGEAKCLEKQQVKRVQIEHELAMQTRSFREIDIDFLELSVRSATCLKNENIKSVGELIEHSELQLLAIPSLGRKSLAEIKDVLGNLGLSLRKWDSNPSCESSDKSVA